MKVTLTKTIAGTCDGQFLTEGSTVDINDVTALFLIERGEAVAHPTGVRTAEVAPSRNAAARVSKPTPRKR